VTLAADPATAWWSRPGLSVEDGRLTIASRDAEALARAHGTPLFVYDLDRFAENARRLLGAFERSGHRHR
jgi:diaminopimelate decarboxylase